MSDEAKPRTRAEIDAQRAIAAKAYYEALYAHPLPFSSEECRERAERWAAEEFPYPTVTRPRVAYAFGLHFSRDYDAVMQRGTGYGGVWRPSSSLILSHIKGLAKLLTREELLEIAAGPCGPTEIVEAE